MSRIKKSSDTRRGFTIVELVVVIAIIGILVGVTIVGYGAWRSKTDLSVLKSDLTNAAAAMEGNTNFQTSYPASVSTVYTPSSGSTVAGGGIGTGNYCVSITRSGVSMSESKLKVQLPGTCPMLYIDPSQSPSYSGSGTAIHDLSGNGNDAITREGATDGAPGPAYDTSDSGGVFVFDGVVDKYRVTPTITFSPNMTWSACTKTLSSKNGFNMFMGAYLPYFGNYTNGTSIIFSNRLSGTQRTVASTSTGLTLNTWNCYAFTTAYDGTNTTMSIYINGTLQSYATFPGMQDNLGYSFTVGDGDSVSAMWYPYNGKVGDVAIYNRTFSAADVSALFGLLRTQYGI